MNKLIRKLLGCGLVLLLLHFTERLQAQGHSYKVNDTLEGNRIVTVVTQNEEHHWIGTTNGLMRISKKTGKKKHYTTTNSLLPCGFITSICCRKNGHVWIGTLKGIVVNDGYYLFWMNTENTNMRDNLISYIIETKDETVWIVTGKSLVRMRHDKFKRFDVEIKEVLTMENGTCAFITSADQSLAEVSFR